MEFLIEGIMALTWKQVVMYAVGILLIWLAIKKEYEPSLLLPMGFGAIMVNLPFSGVLDQVLQGGIESHGIIEWLFNVGIDASEAMPILLVYRYRSNDRLWSAVVQSGHVPVWRGRSVRYFRSGSACGTAGIRPERRSIHRYHRCCRRSDFHPGITDHEFKLHWADRGGGLFLHGSWFRSFSRQPSNWLPQRKSAAFIWITIRRMSAVRCVSHSQSLLRSLLA